MAEAVGRRWEAGLPGRGLAMEKWNVGIVIFDGVEVLDFTGPFEVFSRTRLVSGQEARRSEESAPFKVFTVAKSREPITAIGGLVVVPHHAFAEAPGSISWWSQAASGPALS